MKHLSVILHEERIFRDKLTSCQTPSFFLSFDRIHPQILVQGESPVPTSLPYRTHLWQTVLIDRHIETQLTTVNTLVAFCLAAAPCLFHGRGFATDAGTVERVEFCWVEGGFWSFEKLVFLERIELRQRVGHHAPPLRVLDQVFVSLNSHGLICNVEAYQFISMTFKPLVVVFLDHLA